MLLLFYRIFYCYYFTVLLAVLSSSKPRSSGCGSSESLDAKDDHDQAKKNNSALDNGLSVLLGDTNGSKAALSAASLTVVEYDECIWVFIGNVLMTKSVNGLLSHENLVAYRAMLTFGKTVLGTGSGYCGIDNLGVSESGSGSAAAAVAYLRINAVSSSVIVFESLALDELTCATGLGSVTGCVSPSVSESRFFHVGVVALTLLKFG